MKRSRMVTTFLLVLLGAMAYPAWAVNKCIGPGGQVIFQDIPCAGNGGAIKVRPASGSAPPASDAAAPKPMTETQRLNEQVARSQAERKRQDYELLVLPNAYSALNRHRTACNEELRALQAKKAQALNNLAGATWEQSISTEMSAIATRCDSRSRELLADIEVVRKECQAVGGCQ